MIIVSCIFVLPSLVLFYIFCEQNVTLSPTHFVLFFLIMALAVIGIILVRYVFEAVSTTADFLKKAAEGREKLSLNLHQDALELNEISSSLNSMIERFEKTTKSLNQTKGELHESEEKYRNILENIEEGYYELDLAGNITFFNEACRRIYGYSREELMGRNALKLADEDNAKKAYKYFNEVYTTGRPLTWIDGEITREDGLKRNLEASASLVLDLTGQPIGFRGIIRDVTEHRQAEELYKTLAEKSMAGVYVVQDGKFRFINSNAASYAGYTREELLGSEAGLLVSPEDREKVRQNARAMLLGKEMSPYEYRIITKQGETRWIMETVTSILHEGRRAILGNSMDITESKQAAEALRASEGMYRRLVETANEAIYVAQDGMLKFVNRMTVEITGYSEQELTSTPFSEFIHPDDRDVAVGRHLARIKGETIPDRNQCRIIARDGSIKWAEISGVLIDWEDKLATLNLLTDITERKRAEEALQESEGRYQQLVDNTDTGFVVIDDKGIVITANEPYHRIAGAKAAEDIIGHSVIEWTAPDEQENNAKAVAICARQGFIKDFETVYQHGDGTRLHILINATMHESLEGGKHIVSFCRDITDRKRTEEALLESEEKYRNIIENMQEGYHEVDIKGNFTFVNEAMRKIIGYEYEREELLGMNNRQYTDEENARKVYQVYNRVYRTGEPVNNFEWQIIRKNGDRRDIEVSVSLIRNREGHPTGFRGIVKDATDRKQAEEALRESEELYKTLAEKSLAGVYVVQDGKFRFINSNAASYAGYTKEELLGSEAGLLVSPEDSEKVRQNTRAMLLGKEMSPYEFRIITKQGETRWIMETVTSILHEGWPAILGNSMDITERKRAEEALREGEQRLHSIVDGSPIPAFVIGKDHRVIHWNKALEEMSSIKSEEVVGTYEHWKAFYNEERPCMADLLVDEAVELVPQWYSGKYIKSPLIEDAYEATDFFSTLGENGKWLCFTAAAIRDSQGMIVAAVETLEDITERKQAEEAVRSSEQRLSDIIEFLPDATLVIDRHGKVIAWNRAIEEMTGIKAEDMLGKADYEYALPFYGERRPILIDLALHPEPEIEKSYTGIERKGDILFGESYTPSLPGGDVHLSATASVLRKPDGGVVAAIECIRDNTERREAQENLRQAEERYRNIFDNAQEGIFQTTYEGQYLAANRALATILGYDSPEDLMTTVIDIPTQLYVNPEVRKVLLKMIEEQGPVMGFETQFYRKDGSIIWVSVNQHAVRDAGGRVLHYEGFNEDITMKKGSIERIRKALGATVRAMAVTVETRDPYTAGHQRRVTDLSRAIATEMNLPTDQIDGIRMAAVIHDLGKISVPAEILSKPTKLTDLEFGIIKTHAQSGYDILNDIEFPWPIARIVLEHHERMDGSGYPRGLVVEETLLESRILSVADVVEAMASHRPYRPGLGLDAALQEIEKNRGTLYDIGVVDACLRIFREKGYQLP